MLKFKATKEEFKKIVAIADRAEKLKLNRFEKFSLIMDVEATHCNGNELDFDKLLSFDDANFSHDIVGIQNYINRRTGELSECFTPRCSKIEEAETPIIKEKNDAGRTATK